MRIAIYSRKSKLTEKGDSVENQIQLCKEYALKNFNREVPLENIYEDEGFSGKDTERPDFQSLLKAVKSGKFNVVICYRLDRVSRNISDFSTLIDDFEKYGVSFVSIKEHFDTTTPMGRAMMFIASVFAQLERETTAERINDNMMLLAQTGRWLGGTTPTGFESVPVTSVDDLGKNRKCFKLSPLEDEISIIKLLFEKFLELQSLTKVQHYCMQHDVLTKLKRDFTTTSIKSILTNPVYATADTIIYEYFKNNGYTLSMPVNSFTGQNGVMAYNKTIQKKHLANQLRDPHEWVVAVGEHNGIIDSKQWIDTQKIIERNRSKTYRSVKNNDAVLSGILRCKDCGSFMRPRTGRVNKDGVMQFYYMCELKEKSKKHRCTSPNVKGNTLDQLVIKELKKMSIDNSTLMDSLKSNKVSVNKNQTLLTDEVKQVNQRIKGLEKTISGLVNSLVASDGSTAKKYIIAQIEELDFEKTSLSERLVALKDLSDDANIKNKALDILQQLVNNFADTIDGLSTIDKRNLIKTITGTMLWDGKNIDIHLFDKNVSVTTALQMKYS